MSVFRWLAKSLALPSWLGCTNRTTATPLGWACLSLMVLEDRTAPALLTVNSLAGGPISATTATLTLPEAIALIDTGGTATDASGNSLAAAKASQINTASPFGSNDTIQFAASLFNSAQQQLILQDGSLLVELVAPCAVGCVGSVSDPGMRRSSGGATTA